MQPSTKQPQKPYKDLTKHRFRIDTSPLRPSEEFGQSLDSFESVGFPFQLKSALFRN
jgi:hypothetical protein